ncbi:DNA polymerase epsilon subunit C-like [Durio zibethinus]|uniref:DNA polymerase epsilon subunit C-like n=1 Tax=Durio zibethinus TaxID=66656 RepID=A0A6P5ZME9_DURZI|nr:DNA polymerase epsilon subunit C-like [Durio zibethinus]
MAVDFVKIKRLGMPYLIHDNRNSHVLSITEQSLAGLRPIMHVGKTGQMVDLEIGVAHNKWNVQGASKVRFLRRFNFQVNQNIGGEERKTGQESQYPKKPNKSKPKADNNKNKSSNGTLVESEVIADPSSNTESREQENGNKTNKNVKPNKRKRKEKVEENEEEEAKMFTFPMNRIKRIIKSEDSRMAISQDVVFVVNKATEKFLEQFCEDGYKCSVEDRKKSLSYKHLSMVVCERKRYDFLSDYVPEKIKAEDALKEKNLTETEAG